MKSEVNFVPASNDTPNVRILQFRRNSKRSSLPEVIEEKENSELTSDQEDQRKPRPFDYENIPDPPDGGWGIIVAVSAFLVNVVVDGVSLHSGGSLQDSVIENSNTITYESYGIVIGAQLAVTLLIGPVASVLSKLYGFRLVSMAGSLIASFGIFMSWAVSKNEPNLSALVAFYGVVAGVGLGFMFTVSIVIVGLYFEKYRTLATSFVTSGTGVGLFLMDPILRLIQKRKSWQGILIFEALFVLFSTFLGLAFFPVATKTVPRREDMLTSSGKKGLKQKTKEALHLFTSPSFVLIAISGLVIMFGYFAPFMGIQELEKQLNYNAMDSPNHMDNRSTVLNVTSNIVDTQTNSSVSGGHGLFAIGVSNAVGRILMGVIGHFFELKPLLLTNIAVTIGGVAIILIPIANTNSLVIFFSVIFGLSIACFAAMRSIVIMEYMGIKRFNLAFGFSLLFMGVSVIPALTLTGKLRDVTGSFRIPFYITGALFTLSAVLCYPLPFIKKWEDRIKISKLAE